MGQRTSSPDNGSDADGAVSPTEPPFWRQPAFVIFCGCLISLITFGPRAVMGLFTEPVSFANDWGRDVFALSIAIQNILWGLAQPFAGALIDRYGPAGVLAGGGFLYLAGVALMPVSDAPWAMHMTAGVLIGIGLAGASFAVVISSFGKLVPEHMRSLAFGLGTAAGSLGQFVFAILGQSLIQNFGWAAALYIMAGLLALVPFLALALRLPPGSRPEVHATDIPFLQAMQQAFTHGSYLLLVSGFFVCGFHVAFITTHLPPYLTDLGIAAELAAWSIGFVGLFNIVGSFGSGILGARFSKKYLLSGIYLARAVVILLFITLPLSPVTVIGFSMAIGVLWLSTVPLTSGLVALMFGTRYLATLFGVVFFSHQVGAFIGVWLGGVMYRQTGSYDSMWWIAIVLGLVAALLHWPIAEKPVEQAA